MLDESIKQSGEGIDESSYATHELLTSEACRYLSGRPLMVAAVKFASEHLSTRERENGPSPDQCNDYFHAVRTAKIAYDLGFDDRVIFLSLLHDFINPKHAQSEDRVGELTGFLYQADLSSLGMDPDKVIEELINIEKVERLSKDKTRNTPIYTIAGLFIPQKVRDPQEYESMIETFGVLPFLVNTCEAIDNLQYPKPSGSPRPFDLIEESTNIFEPNLERINDLRQDRMIDDVVRIFRYYLPLLEASGHAEAIREIKDRAIKILAPTCFDRVNQSMSEIQAEEHSRVHEIFNQLSLLVGEGVDKKLDGRKIELTQPFLKGIGSTVIKMLVYGQERPELGSALSRARGEEEIGMAITKILDQMRDLMRCRMVLPEDTRAELGSVFIPAVNKVVREVRKGTLGTKFADSDIETGEAVQIYMKPERAVHAKKILTGIGPLSSGLTVKSKPNGYEGVNIAVCYNGGQRFELQMITTVMAQHNEFGAASHAGFKSGIHGENVRKHTASVQSYMRI